MPAFNTFTIRTVFLFCIGFIVTLPFPFFIIPDVGTNLSNLFIGLNKLWGQLFNLPTTSEFSILSDSTGLYLHLITLIVVSSLFAFFWTLKARSIHSNTEKYFRIFITYYLSLVLFKYGFDKVFKHQFYFPEPNTLYTSVNQLSKDILFWSSMGTSYMYSVFSGVIELIPAVLLLFKKTRLLGGVIAFAVLVNVVMINFGFDISVKIFSIFLLLLSIVVISPDIKRVFQLFTNSIVENKVIENEFKSKKSVVQYALLKSLAIGLILFESIGPYVETQNFNDDIFPKPYLNGAYTVTNSNSSMIKRVFFHRKQYFIIQYSNDSFESFELIFSNDKKSITLISENDSTTYYQLSINFDGQNLEIEGVLKGEKIILNTTRENLKTKSISKDTFNWTMD